MTGCDATSGDFREDETNAPPSRLAGAPRFSHRALALRDAPRPRAALGDFRSLVGLLSSRGASRASAQEVASGEGKRPRNLPRAQIGIRIAGSRPGSRFREALILLGSGVKRETPGLSRFPRVPP